MRISDGSSDVCSSDLKLFHVQWRYRPRRIDVQRLPAAHAARAGGRGEFAQHGHARLRVAGRLRKRGEGQRLQCVAGEDRGGLVEDRSEEHTSELQSIMRISYAVFCLKKKTHKKTKKHVMEHYNRTRIQSIE